MSGSYRCNINLSAIIYLHNINDNWTPGSALKNLQVFSALCGTDAMKKAVVVTTMWDKTTRERGLRREHELKTVFLPEVMAAGCGVKRFDNTYESAWSIIHDLEADRAGVQQRPGDKRQTVDQQGVEEVRKRVVGVNEEWRRKEKETEAYKCGIQ